MGAPTTAFNAEYGTQQGRIESADAVAGTHLLQLGHATAGVRRFFTHGDMHRVQSTFDMTGMLKIRFSTRIRLATLPSGWRWIFITYVDDLPFFEWPIDRTFNSSDGAVVPGFIVQGGGVLPLQFELTALGPGNGEVAELELPGLSIDAIIEEAVATDFDVFARNPGPNETGVPLDCTLRFCIAKVAVNFDMSASDIDVTVNGTQVVIDGVIQTGWSGNVIGSGLPGNDWLFRLDLAPDVPFDPLTTIQVVVTVRDTETFSWSFESADTIAPIIESAFAPSPTTVRVVFDEPIDEETAVDPDSYLLSLVSGAPAVVPGVVSVEFESPSTVILTLATIMTRGAIYLVTVEDVADVFGNVITAPINTAQFAGYRWPVPAGRRTKLFEMLPENVRVKDVSGEHERFLGVMQELFDIYYGVADKALEIVDPDFAPIEAVDNMLSDLGNPFDFLELTDIEKRILAQTLLAIYKTKGTGPGVVNALQFFLGIEASIRVYAWAPYPIGEAIIGETFVLGSSVQSDLYTFEVVVQVFLTDTERKNLTAIVDYMKVAHEHWRLIEPQPPLNINHWSIGFSLLGTETFLHP